MKINKFGLVLLLSHSLLYGQTIFGDSDCGEWVSNKNGSRAWLLGFLSGINSMQANVKYKYDPLGKLNSASQAFLWMDNYCKANPLMYVHEGALILYGELQKNYPK